MYNMFFIQSFVIVAYILNVLLRIFSQMFQYSCHVPINNIFQVLKLIHKNLKERKKEREKKKSGEKRKSLSANLPLSFPALSVWSIYVGVL